MTRITASDVGHHFVHEDGSVWIVVGYREQPTAILERLERVETAQRPDFTPCQVVGAAGAPIFDPFQRLIVEP